MLKPLLLAAMLAPCQALAQTWLAPEERPAAAPVDMRDREAQVQDRILDAMARGRLDGRLGRRLFRQLDDVRRFDTIYRDADGRMTPDQTRDVQMRLDAVRAELDTALSETARTAQSARNGQVPGPR
jgi:hypothetical protein